MGCLHGRYIQCHAEGVVDNDSVGIIVRMAYPNQGVSGSTAPGENHKIVCRLFSPRKRKLAGKPAATHTPNMSQIHISFVFQTP
jgi:hypothetical protein